MWDVAEKERYNISYSHTSDNISYTVTVEVLWCHAIVNCSVGYTYEDYSQKEDNDDSAHNMPKAAIFLIKSDSYCYHINERCSHHTSPCCGNKSAELKKWS